MTPFLVVTTAQPVIAAIQRVYAEANFKYAENVWFLADNGVTAQEVYRKLVSSLPQPQQNQTAVVCSVAGYYGVAGKNLWEWLAAKGNAVR